MGLPICQEAAGFLAEPEGVKFVSSLQGKNSIMRLCFPIEADNGANSLVFGHFGSAPHFLLLDTEQNTTALVDNGNADHEHGKCNPIQALQGQAVDAVIVGGIGPGAVTRLAELGIHVFRAVPSTVQANAALWQQGALPELTLDEACQHHGEHGHAHA